MKEHLFAELLRSAQEAADKGRQEPSRQFRAVVVDGHVDVVMVRREKTTGRNDDTVIWSCLWLLPTIAIGREGIAGIAIRYHNLYRVIVSR